MRSSPMQKIQFAIHSVFKDCLRIRNNETLLIVADEPMREIGLSFYKESETFTKKKNLLLIPRLEHAYMEPAQGVSVLMAQSDIVILLTSKSLSHTQARRKACKNGARIISLPGVSPDTLARTMNGQYKDMIASSRKVADILTIGKFAHLHSKNGSDLTLSLARVKGYADTGIVQERGQFSNIPAGEGCAGPAQGSAQGVLVVDGSFPGIGILNEPVRFRIKDGYVVRISGNREAEQVRKILKNFGQPGKMIAEIGVGTNPNAKFSGLTLEDEKTRGTVHLALGNNLSFDGKNDVPCHFDCVLRKPTLTIDGITIVSNGALQV